MRYQELKIRLEPREGTTYDVAATGRIESAEMQRARDFGARLPHGVRYAACIALVALTTGLSVVASASAAPQASDKQAFDPVPIIRLLGDLRTQFRPFQQAAVKLSLDTALDTLVATRSVTRAHEALARLVYSRNFYERLAVAGVCSGMAYLAAHPESNTTSDSWRNYLFGIVDGYFRKIGQSYSARAALGHIDYVMTSLRIAQTSPAEALFYARACRPG